MKQTKSIVMNKKELEKLFNTKIPSKEYKNITAVLNSENYINRDNLIGSLFEYKELINHSPNKSISDLLIAFKYVSYIHSGHTVFDSYVKSHSNVKHIKKFLKKQLINPNSDEVKSLKESIKHECTLYSKSKFIIKVTNTLDFPLHLIYNGYRYQAIECLRKDMLNATRSQDRINAADKLLNHLNPTLNQTNININLGEGTKSLIDTYQEALEMLANKKLEKLDNGEDLKKVTNYNIHKNVLEGEIEE